MFFRQEKLLPFYLAFLGLFFLPAKNGSILGGSGHWPGGWGGADSKKMGGGFFKNGVGEGV